MVLGTISYDNIYQLLSATQNGSATESYSYDAVGNRLSSVAGSYGYNNSNEMNTAPGATFTYDNNGNTLSKTDATGTTNYAWDFENRLTSVTLPGTAGTVQFSYDPVGRRIKKSSSAGTSIFAYDGDNLIEESNSSVAVIARYSQGLNIDEPLAMLRSGTTSFYNADGLGSVTSLANASGTLAQTYTFDSFGKQTASSGSLTNPFQYAARESDSETGLYYYRARYYDPGAGRFLNEDPVGFNAGPNFYSYVGNSPTLLIDPSGNYARLNPKSRCARAFAQALKTGLCAEDFAKAFNEEASKIPMYTVRSDKSPAANLTQDSIAGNGSQTKLGEPFFNYMDYPAAYTITNGKQPAIVLGPDYFLEPLDMRLASLMHEEFHALTLLDDAAIFNLFNKYGLPDVNFKNWPHPTSEFSDWIRKGCPPKGKK